MYCHLIYDKDDTAVQWRKDGSSINVLDQLDEQYGKKLILASAVSFHKNQFQKDYRSKCERQN